MKANNFTPIFIHSLFRSGSTYVFNKFRQSDNNYCCYQEPLNEQLLSAKTEPDKLLKIDKRTQSFLRHPVLNKPYFHEFYIISDVVGKHFKKEFSYDQYFTNKSSDLISLATYFTALQNNSNGRPVFQCCRTSGRVAGIKSISGGLHLDLWRNPWDQWWSYKKDVFFDKANQHILNAENLPPVFASLKEELPPLPIDYESIFSEHGLAGDYQLDAIDSYKIFYALWCHARLEVKPHCELSINIDKLSTSSIYKDKIIEKMKNLGIDGIDFSDCAIPIAHYGESDRDFFSPIEEYIHNLFLSHSYTPLQVDELRSHSNKPRESSIDSNPQHPSVRDIVHVREYLLQTESRLVSMQNALLKTHEQIHNDLEQAHNNLEQANNRATLAETRLQNIINSHSWQITSPLRWIKHQANALLQQAPLTRAKSLAKKVTRPFFRSGIAYINTHPTFRYYLIVLFKKIGIYTLVRSIYLRLSGQNGRISFTSKHRHKALNPCNAEDLTPYAREIYNSLKKTIAQPPVDSK